MGFKIHICRLSCHKDHLKDHFDTSLILEGYTRTEFQQQKTELFCASFYYLMYIRGKISCFSMKIN